MQEALGAGASLSRLVIEANEPAAGSVWTFAPGGFEMASLKRFTHSIDWRGEQGQIYDYLLGCLHERLRRSGAWLVIEDRFLDAPRHDPECAYSSSGKRCTTS